jgi:hypothetical protein
MAAVRRGDYIEDARRAVQAFADRVVRRKGCSSPLHCEGEWDAEDFPRHSSPDCEK